ncbi:hypothetical protein ACLOJK_024863 [Asimina triloba]
MISAAWGIGLIVGPAIGDFLALISILPTLPLHFSVFGCFPSGLSFDARDSALPWRRGQSKLQ